MTEIPRTQHKVVGLAMTEELQRVFGPYHANFCGIELIEHDVRVEGVSVLMDGVHVNYSDSTELIFVPRKRDLDTEA